jgi:hypothetical protein
MVFTARLQHTQECEMVMAVWPKAASWLTSLISPPVHPPDLVNEFRASPDIFLLTHIPQKA